MGSSTRAILLTFDVEEFDLPLEYHVPIPESEQMLVGAAGLHAINEILSRKNLECTLFTTAHFAQQFPETIVALSARHEIASHTFYHSSFKEEDLLTSRLALEEIITKKVLGIRMPRMKQVDPLAIQQAGYSYDSSMNPTWLPGRYNHWRKPRTFYTETILKFPVSVSPNFRIPLFWLAFKNFPYTYYKRLAIQTLKKDGYLSLYFHPWEFTDLSPFAIPNMVKRISGIELVSRLHRLIADLEPHGDFISIQHFLESKGKLSI